MILDVIKFAIANNLVILQFPSHSTHATQFLDVGAFGIFKSTDSLQGWYQTHGNRMLIKIDMNKVIRLSWGQYFTPSQVMAPFEGSSVWPVAADRAISRFKGKEPKE